MIDEGTMHHAMLVNPSADWATARKRCDGVVQEGGCCSWRGSRGLWDKLKMSMCKRRLEVFVAWWVGEKRSSSAPQVTTERLDGGHLPLICQVVHAVQPPPSNLRTTYESS